MKHPKLRRGHVIRNTSIELANGGTRQTIVVELYPEAASGAYEPPLEFETRGSPGSLFVAIAAFLGVTIVYAVLLWGTA